MQKDIFEYDELNLYAKKDKSAEIIENYKNFNWTLENEVENDKYEDLSDLTFSRPHKIKNKDELQLLQVYMEENLNLIGKLEKYKHARSQAFGLCLGGLIIALLSLAVWYFVSFSNITYYFVSACVMCSISLICIILMIIFLPKIIKKENKRYIEIHKKLEDEVSEICSKAKNLVGGGKNEN